jgi:hypothetical protein
LNNLKEVKLLERRRKVKVDTAEMKCDNEILINVAAYNKTDQI